jgi:hypothetical protein
LLRPATLKHEKRSAIEKQMTAAKARRRIANEEFG